MSVVGHEDRNVVVIVLLMMIIIIIIITTVPGSLRSYVIRKTAEVFALFTRQIEQTRHEFDENRRNPPIRENEPEFAGAALWARSLATMVRAVMVIMTIVGCSRWYVQ
jgi:hypothetical protein